MPLKKPMLTLALEDESSEEESDDDVVESSGGSGLRAGLGKLSLSVEEEDGYDDDSPPGGKR